MAQVSSISSYIPKSDGWRTLSDNRWCPVIEEALYIGDEPNLVNNLQLCSMIGVDEQP